MRQLSLPKQFPDAPFVARTKIWTPQRNSAEITGPYDEVAGELLLMVATIAHPKGKKLAAMKKCLKILLEKDSGKKKSKA